MPEVTTAVDGKVTITFNTNKVIRESKSGKSDIIALMDGIKVNGVVIKLTVYKPHN